MIFIIEKPAAPDETPYAWFAYDEEDLLGKLAERGLLEGWQSQGHDTLEDLVEAVLRQTSPDFRIYWEEAEATAAFERAGDAFWQDRGWRARWALREQLIALEILADDL